MPKTKDLCFFLENQPGQQGQDSGAAETGKSLLNEPNPQIINALVVRAEAARLRLV